MTTEAKGKLYGIGTGPGDPELLTIKAVSAIEKCGVIAYPGGGKTDKTALTIVERYLAGKELLECDFPMCKSEEKRIEARRAAAERIAACLAAGKNVGFVTLGDPTTYSTYMYVHKIVTAKGFAAQIIPGITSYSAAAAALGTALCEGGRALTIIPGGNAESLGALLDSPGSKVIMKSGEGLPYALKKLKERGLDAKIACRVTMEGQRLYNSIEEFEREPEMGYFTVALVEGKE